jgi:hypothetical protein
MKGQAVACTAEDLAQATKLANSIGPAPQRVVSRAEDD